MLQERNLYSKINMQNAVFSRLNKNWFLFFSSKHTHTHTHTLTHTHIYTCGTCIKKYCIAKVTNLKNTETFKREMKQSKIKGSKFRGKIQLQTFSGIQLATTTKKIMIKIFNEKLCLVELWWLLLIISFHISCADNL